MDKKAVIFIGSPGSGKGTQAVLLEKEFGFFHIETSQLIEDKFANIKPSDSDYEEVMKEKDLFDKGILIDPPFVVELMTTEFRKMAKNSKSIVLSGSPRTLYEAEREIPVLIEEYGRENIYLIHMLVSEETSISRNSKRRICKKERHPIPYLPETKDLDTCPEDGSPLVDRGILDNPETIKIRLREYRERTEPVLKLAEEKFGIKPVFVDGEKPINERFEKIKKIVGL